MVANHVKDIVDNAWQSVYAECTIARWSFRHNDIWECTKNYVSHSIE